MNGRIHNRLSALVFWGIVSFSISPVAAQDITRLGGDLTTEIPGHNALQVAAPNLTLPEKRDRQLSGFGIFHNILTQNEGLGPRFVNDGCGSCHVQNGRGAVRISRISERRNSMVIKVALRGALEANGAPRAVPGVGEQLQERTVAGRSLYKPRLRWMKIKGRYPDGTKYELRRPRLSFKIKGYNRDELVTSLRMTPGLVGLGLLEAIPEATILELSDPLDLNKDGISGVPSYVFDRRTGGLALGRFGFRASNTTIEQQTAAAAFNDMGVTSVLFNEEAAPIELSDDALDRLVVYQALPGVPIARDQDKPEVIRGKGIFQEIGCNNCHTISLVTEHPVHPELTGQLIHPFTDLLLHDMGPGLADKRVEFSASGSEWRTTPLWGLGFVPGVSHIRTRFLHDGRARTLQEAIIWHDGEAKKSKNAFMTMQKADRDALIAFLQSL